MNIQRIKNANTEFIGKEIIYKKEMNSTQEEATKMKNETKNGTIFLTDYQLKGKGTKGRSWHSSKGKNIMMTIALYPNCKVEQIEGVTVLIAQIIKEVMEEQYHILFEIKQPNDLLLNGKKIVGILTQSTIYKEIVKELLIGIGFNVNESEFQEEIEAIATSLKREFHHNFEREEIIATFIEKLERELKNKKIIK